MCQEDGDIGGGNAAATWEVGEEASSVGSCDAGTPSSVFSQTGDDASVGDVSGRTDGSE